VAQGLPMIVALDSSSTPVNSTIIVRADIADQFKAPADLKGKRVGIVAPGSIPEYAVGKVLESVGLGLKDIEIKYVPFQAMGAALQNGALDAALEVPPYTEKILGQGIAKAWIDPDSVVRPSPTITVAYMINTDWAAQNKDAAHRVMLAFARAGRDYCDAYHHGPNRGQAIDELVQNHVMDDRALLDGMKWQSRDPNGKVSLAALSDIQDFFFRQGKLAKKAPEDRLLDASYAAEAEQKFGPFTPKNAASPLKGCR
jgi:NitT/TauT family transport system substrate-binding protein